MVFWLAVRAFALYCVSSVWLRINSIRINSIRINSKKSGGCAPRTPQFGAGPLTHTREKRSDHDRPLHPNPSLSAENAETKNCAVQFLNQFGGIIDTFHSARPVNRV